ncbi:MAG: AzlC family ABC transporter permease [Spirochaetaceae bacterium]|nr:AzlC family ABC transporter permease [Spirochaetaceae bacterium]
MGYVNSLVNERGIVVGKEIYYNGGVNPRFPIKSSVSFKPAVLLAAFKYSVPVLLGYLAIGIGFGLLLTGAGYPWWLALLMSLWMYAGAGQYIAVGLFAAGTSLVQACLIQLAVNARHIAYGLSMLKRFDGTGPFKPYLVFSLTDETFALLSSLPEKSDFSRAEERRFFMFCVSVLDQCYWTLGSIAGAVAGTLIPFDMNGISFALTALFVVLMIEQIQRVKRPGIFIVSGVMALLGVFFLPGEFSLLAALVLAFLLSFFIERKMKFSGGGEHE